MSLPFVAGVEPGAGRYRATLTDNVPVTTGDVTAAANVYCVPYWGNRLSLFTGTEWVGVPFSSTGLSIASITGAANGKTVDVFGKIISGALGFVVSAVWTNDTTRADALGSQDGVPCLGSDPTARWLFSLTMTSGTTTEDSEAKRYLTTAAPWLRVPRKCKRIDNTDSWNYSSSTWRQAHGSGNNQFSLLNPDDQGGGMWGELRVDVPSCSAPPDDVCVGIGLGSTSVNSADLYGDAGNIPTASDRQSHAVLKTWLPFGRQEVVWLESTSSTPGVVGTFFGDAGGSGATQQFQGGIIATIWA